MTVPSESVDVLGSEVAPRRRGRRRRMVGATVLSAAAAAGAVLAPGVVSNGAGEGRGTESSGSLRQEAALSAAAVTCPQSTFPDTQNPGLGYSIAVKAIIPELTLRSGWHEQGQFWGSTATNITATACGLLQVPSLRVDIAGDDLVFDTSEAVIETLAYDPVQQKPIPQFRPGEVAVDLTPLGPAVTTVSGVRPDGALDLGVANPVRLTVKDGPLYASDYACNAESAPALTTARSTNRPSARGLNGPVQDGVPDPQPWTLEGRPLSGAFIGAEAVVVANDFALPIFPPDPSDPFSPCALFNGTLSGATEEGTIYFRVPELQPYTEHEPGVSQVLGTLRITELDENALYLEGPPTTVPGT